MAVNEKTVRATTHTTFGGRMFRPGETMSGSVPDYVLRSALENGTATDVSARAEEAAKDDAGRRERVAAEKQSRSTKRDHNKTD